MTTANGLDAVKAATWTLHTKAERSGIIADILAGRASREGIALLLRNLLPVYQVLDASVFSRPALARSAAIEADLRVLSPDAEPALLPEGEAYAERVSQAARRNVNDLIAHAYLRYLGDLNGGPILQRGLITSFGDTAKALMFNQHPTIEDRPCFARTYRSELNEAVRIADLAEVVQETIAAFELNIALSVAVGAQSMPIPPA